MSLKWVCVELSASCLILACRRGASQLICRVELHVKLVSTYRTCLCQTTILQHNYEGTASALPGSK